MQPSPPGRSLLAHGANINARDHEGQTPLLYVACCQGSEAFAQNAHLRPGRSTTARTSMRGTAMGARRRFAPSSVALTGVTTIGVLRPRTNRSRSASSPGCSTQGSDLEAKGTKVASTPLRDYIQDRRTRPRSGWERQFLYPRTHPQTRARARRDGHCQRPDALGSQLRLVSVAPAAEYDAPPTLAGFLQKRSLAIFRVRPQPDGPRPPPARPDGTVAEAVNLPLRFDPMPTDLSGWPSPALG